MPTMTKSTFKQKTGARSVSRHEVEHYLATRLGVEANVTVSGETVFINVKRGDENKLKKFLN